METQGFWDGKAEYGDAELAGFFAAFFESGICKHAETLDFAVTIGSGTNLAIASGFAVIEGHWLNAPAQNISYSGKTGKQLVLIRMNTSTKRIEITLDTAVRRTSTMYDLCLAEFDVSTKALKDTRTNETVCGMCRPKNMTDLPEFIENTKQTVDEWLEGIQGQVERPIFIQTEEPQSAIAGSIWLE